MLLWPIFFFFFFVVVFFFFAMISKKKDLCYFVTFLIIFRDATIEFSKKPENYNSLQFYRVIKHPLQLIDGRRKLWDENFENKMVK